MTRKNLIASVCILAFCCSPVSLLAEDETSGYHADFLNDFDRTAKKLRELADAMPKDAFSWRLTDDVRSVSEIYMHVAGANFHFARDLGVELPADLPEEMEKNVTRKAEVKLLFLESLDHVHQALEMNQDLDRKMELFGRKRSIRSIFMILAGHAHEHLGQMIAYARAKGIVPPWSQSDSP